MWEAQTGKELRTFKGHTDAVFSVAFSPDGKQVLTGSEDKTARLWEAQTGKELRTFKGHTERVCAVAFSPDGTQVLTGSRDSMMQWWESQTGKKLHTFKGPADLVWAVACSPDGKQILTGSKQKLSETENILLRGSADKAARLWDAQSGKELRAFTGYAGAVQAVAFSPDGKQILTGSGNHTARLWDVQSGWELRAFRGHADVVWAVAFSPDGKLVLTGSRDQTARLWDAQTGKELRTFKGQVNSVAFSPDGTQVLTGSFDDRAYLWDARSGNRLRTFVGFYAGAIDGFTSVAFSPDGKQVLTGGAPKACLWDAQNGKMIRDFCPGEKRASEKVGPDGVITTIVTIGGSQVDAVAFSPDGKQVLTGSAGEAVWLWDAQTGKKIRNFKVPDYVQSVAFSPDGKQVLTGGNTARLWDAQTGKELRAFTEGGVAFSPDGKHILTGSVDNTTRIWESQTGRELCRLISFREGSWAVVDPEGRFDSANGGDMDGLHWVVGNEPIDLKQLKERSYDPGLLAKVMGFNKEPLRPIAAFTEVKLHPDVTIVNIKPGDRKLTLDLTNRGGGIGRVQVFVNGKELLADARGPKPDEDAKQSTLTVDLSGAHVIPGKPNRVEVVTWNAEGYLSSRGLVREWTPEGDVDPNPPELYVIVCGVSEYAEPKLNLRFASKDATDMARALELAGKRLFGADKVHMILLSTGAHPKAVKPTKENIRKAFEGVRKAKPTDVLVVYLAGHGVALKRGADEYCYLTADARSTDTTALADPAVLASWAVTSSELVDWIKKIPALKQVMLLDTCAAGAAATKLLEHRDLSGDQIRALGRLKERTGFHVLMGCSADRVSYEASEYSQGLLTYSLLKGMAGAKLREGEYVDVSGLFQYAADEVPQLARGIGGVQKPLVIAPRGTSFDIGRLVEADRKALPLAKPQPLILRPLLSNAEDGDDNLKLAGLVRKQLADDSFITPRSTDITTVYVDADEMAGAVRPAGTYTVDGKKVSVRLVLKRDDKTLNKVTVDGSIDDLAGLTIMIVEAIRKGSKNP